MNVWRQRVASAGDRAMATLWAEYYSAGNVLSVKLVAKAWVNQKVLRRNSHVPWPVHPSTVVKAPEKISRGTRTPGMGVGCYIDGRNGIVIGDNVWIGPYVRIISMSHDVNNFYEFEEESPIRIGDNCWLGAGATILPGVVLGPHTVVGAGAVVTKSFPQGDCLIAGNPAVVKKQLPLYGQIHS